MSCSLGIASISTSFTKFINLDNSTVESYELVTDEHRKSAKSGIGRGIVGGALLGPVGMLGVLYLLSPRVFIPLLSNLRMAKVC